MKTNAVIPGKQSGLLKTQISVIRNPPIVSDWANETSEHCGGNSAERVHNFRTMERNEKRKETDLVGHNPPQS